MKRAISTLLVLAACTTAPKQAEAAELRVLNWCDLPGNTCGECTEEICAPPDFQELNWCCPWEGDPCYPVEFISMCDPEQDYAVICEWGRVLLDGSIECYD